MAGIISPAGNAIITGTPAVFNEANTCDISVASLSDTKALVTYNARGYGVTCVLNILGNKITPGTPVVFNETYTAYTSVTALSPDKALVTYQDADYSGTACVLDISGTTITPGTPAVFEAASTYYISVTALSSTRVLVTYQGDENSNYGKARVLDISGNTITPGIPAVFEAASTDYTSVTALSHDKALVTYTDAGNSNYGTACVLDISGTTITPGTPAVLNTANIGYISVTALSSTQALVTYGSAENSYRCIICILNISGNTITLGNQVVFNETYAFHISATALSPTKALVIYQLDSYYGTACVLDISGNTITPCTQVVFNEANTYYISVTALSSTQALVTYRDYGNSNYGTACILDIEGEA